MSALIGEKNKWGETLDANENKNFLNGKQCPKCGNRRCFRVEVTVPLSVGVVCLFDKGYDPNDLGRPKIVYTDKSKIHCDPKSWGCGYRGTISDLKAAYTVAHTQVKEPT